MMGKQDELSKHAYKSDDNEKFMEFKLIVQVLVVRVPHDAVPSLLLF